MGFTHLTRFVRRSVTLVSAVAVAASLSTEADATTAETWTWTEKEERTLGKLERRVKEEEGVFRLSESHAWRVETPGSARLAAEIGLYLAMLETAVLDLTGAKRELAAYPTVKVYASTSELREAVPETRGRTVYRYRWENNDYGNNVMRKQVVENHLYTTLNGSDEVGLARIDLDALRAEGTRAVLCGIFSQYQVAPWFEDGVTSFFATWDLRVTGRAADEDAFDARRARSTNMPSRPAGDAAPEPLPPLAPLLGQDLAGYARNRVVPGMSNRAAAESLVDALISAKGAKSLRQAVMKEISKSAARGRKKTVLESKTVARLEKLWQSHLESLSRAE